MRSVQPYRALAGTGTVLELAYWTGVPSPRPLRASALRTTTPGARSI
ncbi:hypothetical protein [Kitasatospora sp. NPDC087314]